MNMLNILSGICAVALILLLFPRMIAMHPGTTRAIYLFIYPAKFLWACAVLTESIGGGVAWYTPLALVGMLAWAVHTRGQWRGGKLPSFARSDVAPLDLDLTSGPAGVEE